MSAQSLNGSNYTGYNAGAPSASNPSGAVPTRDASDITRQLKERLIFNGFNANSVVKPGGANMVFQRAQVNPAGVNHIPGNSEWSWLPFGNQFRLSYFFGKMNNSTIPGGAVTFSSPSATYAVSVDPRPLGFVPGAYMTASGNYAAANTGTFLITSSTATTIVVTNSGGQAGATSSGTLTLCTAGLFNGNGPKLPGKTTSAGS